MRNIHESRVVLIEYLLDGPSHNLPVFGKILAARARTSITNEANLTGGENVGSTGADAVTVSADDDGDGDGDPDPDRRKKSRKAKPHEAPVEVEPTERRIEPEHTSDKAGRDQHRWRLITRSNTDTPDNAGRTASNRQNRTRKNMTETVLATSHAALVTPSATLTLPLEGYARLPQVLAAIPVSKSSWWAGCKSGRYPAPVKLGPRTTVWKVSDIRALIAAA